MARLLCLMLTPLQFLSASDNWSAFINPHQFLQKKWKRKSCLTHCVTFRTYITLIRRRRVGATTSSGRLMVAFVEIRSWYCNVTKKQRSILNGGGSDDGDHRRTWQRWVMMGLHRRCILWACSWWSEGSAAPRCCTNDVALVTDGVRKSREEKLCGFCCGFNAHSSWVLLGEVWRQNRGG